MVRQQQDHNRRRSSDADIAVLQTEMQHVRDDMQELKKLAEGLSEHLGAVQKQLGEFRSNGRTLLWVGSGLGAFAVWVIDHLIRWWWK